MKKLIILSLVLTSMLFGCGKSEAPFDPVKQAADDDLAIQAYIKANNIAATKDASGLYYQIVTQGTGTNATVTSTVSVNYSGKLLDGTQFDTNAGKGAFTTALTVNGIPQVITGWVIGIPLVKAGGRILLIIPSGLGYANSSVGTIPANSVLVFTVDVLTVK